MTVRIYQSTDTSAPVLTGQTGTLVTLLQKCLYGDGSGVAYGTGGTQKLAAGWSLPFTPSANKTVLRNSVAAGGSGCYLRILDDASITNAQWAGSFVYQSMSDIDTGSDGAPTTTQDSVGARLFKSNSANSTARPWIVIADERTAYVSIQNDTAPSFSFFAFGDIDSDTGGDAYNYVNCGANNGAGATTAANWMQLTAAGVTGGSYVGGSIGRSHTQSGTAKVVAVLPSFGLTVNYVSQISDPAPGSGLRYFAPIFCQADGTIRGRFRGCFMSPCSVTDALGTSIASPAGFPSGTNLIVMGASVGNRTNVFIDIGNAW
jgi:hypothetical protein